MAQRFSDLKTPLFMQCNWLKAAALNIIWPATPYIFLYVACQGTFWEDEEGRGSQKRSQTMRMYQSTWSQPHSFLQAKVNQIIKFMSSTTGQWEGTRASSRQRGASGGGCWSLDGVSEPTHENGGMEPACEQRDSKGGIRADEVDEEVTEPSHSPVRKYPLRLSNPPKALTIHLANFKLHPVTNNVVYSFEIEKQVHGQIVSLLRQS